MSVSTLLTPLPGKDWCNIYVNSINGVPLPPPPVTFDSNPANIIYKPGSAPVTGSNIVQTWAQVISKADQANVNQCINVYLDDSIVSPCVIDQSYDCKNRVVFQPYQNFASGSSVQALIQDGVILTNPRSFSGSMDVFLDSQTSPCVIINQGNIDVSENGARLNLAATATIPGIFVQQGGVLGIGYGSNLSNSLAPAVSLILVDSASTLIISFALNFGMASFLPNLISSIDGTSSLIVVYDASVDITSLTAATVGFTGSINTSNIDRAQNLFYDDSAQAPPSGSNQVQGAIDWLKTQIGGGSNVSATSTSVSGSIAVPTTTLVKINNWTSVNLSGGITYGSGDFTLPNTGVYSISCSVQGVVLTNPLITGLVSIWRNGVSILSASTVTSSSAGSAFYISTSSISSLSASDVISIQVQFSYAPGTSDVTGVSVGISQLS